MTFSITGHCARTGMAGVAITTSSICVGSRCPHARAGVGAVATQNITDPTLATRVFECLQAGETAAEAVATVMDGRANAEYRQLAVVDMAGRTGHFTGAHILGTNRVVEGDHCIAAGNLLSTPEVPAAMVAGFEADPGAHLADRLLLGLEAGLAAGGEEGPVRSAALLVHHEQPFALVDLRCDWNEDDPVVVLRRLWTDYEPQMQPYLDRAVDPGVAPSYGVAGDR
ncbi:MAG: DUF1028 domain-containing protein [Acidimicrobiales bacterium]|nr:DUF1028 domain-containing protein [Actinomycetes bacterium]MDP6159312.1 DUF1028 domain-containing protein [Acidimicrobiales bacterium]HCW01655.1 DUF1028 domain-containing protein [Acidimicrobiaceae bacterium]MDP6286986.1 DUF1028 domain-containing protein [Acidimicrobiales bacterium]MDP6910298.1 DUF1028 domain-containing protein [Acidimicrobiales bacterium]